MAALSSRPLNILTTAADKKLYFGRKPLDFSHFFVKKVTKCFFFDTISETDKIARQRHILPNTPVGEDGMQFCKDCGGVLNLFGKEGRELCPACIQNQKAVMPPPPVRRKEEDDLLEGTLLSIENGKIVLRSKEGWELWSGPPGVRTELSTVYSQARRIYAIRLRRQKN